MRRVQNSKSSHFTFEELGKSRVILLWRGLDNNSQLRIICAAGEREKYRSCHFNVLSVLVLVAGGVSRRPNWLF
jgi:hypothetical protein